MTQSQWEEGSSHFSRDILDIRLFSKDSGFSRMVEWAGARRIGIRWWKPYKDVAKASTRRRFHLGNLREHSIVAVITRIRGTDNFTYASSWPRSSIASNRNETASFSEFMRRRGGVDRYLSPSLSLLLILLYLFPSFFDSIEYLSSCDSSRFIRRGTTHSSNLHRIGERWKRGGREIAIEPLRNRFRERESCVMVRRLQIRKARWLVHGNFRDLNDTHWPLSLVGNRNSM